MGKKNEHEKWGLRYRPTLQSKKWRYEYSRTPVNYAYETFIQFQELLRTKSPYILIATPEIFLKYFDWTHNNLEMQELESKVSQTTPYKNLKRILQRKNEQLKDFRKRLSK